MTLQWACQPFTTVDAVLDAPCGCPMEAADPIETWIDMASDVLYYLSDGYVTGVCTATARPVTSHDHCLPRTIGPWAFSGWRGCCEYGPRLYLRSPNPVVHEVKFDGAVLDPEEYALVDDYWLIRRHASWPVRNNLSEPDTEDGTWSINYSWGNAADYITEQAAIEMTCELAKYAGVGSSEVFPPGVITANVQGATASLEGFAEAVMEGRELMPKVARFIARYGGRGQSAHVFSPEIEAYRLLELTYFS
jgi:hypothetical protein